MSEGRKFTLQELRQYDGHDDNTPIYIAAKDIVFDVSKGREFYGAGAKYHIFAGRDATVALAKTSLEAEDLDKGIEEVSEGDMKTLNGFLDVFKKKYEIVGSLVGSKL